LGISLGKTELLRNKCLATDWPSPDLPTGRQVAVEILFLGSGYSLYKRTRTDEKKIATNSWKKLQNNKQ
jgi:hypothetical protein